MPVAWQTGQTAARARITERKTSAFETTLGEAPAAGFAEAASQWRFEVRTRYVDWPC